MLHSNFTCFTGEELSSALVEEGRLMVFEGRMLRTFEPEIEDVTGRWRLLCIKDASDWYFGGGF
jgi:hypothetical protein